MEGEFDEYARGNPAVKGPADKEWDKTGKGMVASNGYGMFTFMVELTADCGFKILPTKEELEAMGPECVVLIKRMIFSLISQDRQILECDIIRQARQGVLHRQ